MEFIAILIGLAIERWSPLGRQIRDFKLLNKYIALFNPMKIPAIFGIWLIILPPVLIIELLYVWWTHALYSHIITYSLLSLILAVFVLLYCLGGFNLGSPAPTTTLVAKTEHEKEIAGLLIEANQNIFAVLFWFVVFGPAGALLYRLIELLGRHTEKADYAMLSKKARLILDWIPSRLLAFGSALMSHFMVVLKTWAKHVLSGIDNNDHLLAECGYIAFEVEQEHKFSSVEEIRKQVLNLIDRSLILWLVIIALVIVI